MEKAPKKIVTKEEFPKLVKKIAKEIHQRHPTLDDVVIVGIRTRGVPIAKRIIGELKKISNSEPSFGILDISFYRDDLSKKYPFPEVLGTQIETSVDLKTVILVDDVLYTGRTVRAAMDELLDHGRPSRIEVAVLIDRGLRELPICADYIGMKVDTENNQLIEVKIRPVDSEDAVYLVYLTQREGKR